MNNKIKYRHYKKSDTPFLDIIYQDKNIMANIPFNKKKSYLFLIDNNIVGFFNVEKLHGYPEIQYAILKEYRNLGLGSMLLENLTTLMFLNTNCEKIYLMINRKNTPSLKVASKNGYQIDYDLESNDIDFPYYNLYKNNPYYEKELSSKILSLKFLNIS